MSWPGRHVHDVVICRRPRDVTIDTGDPVPYSVVVFRDPDNIQLELIYMAG
jgi:hypothetical protein